MGEEMNRPRRATGLLQARPRLPHVGPPRVAYADMMSRLSAPELPDQSGRTWLITGATNGVGRELALAVARAGGALIAPARDEQRAQRLAADVRRVGGVVDTPVLDLADLTSVRHCAAGLTTDVDVMVNNAGLITPRRRETADGFEMLLGVNFLGPFALTNLVAHRVRERFVITGSDAHKSAHVDAADPHFRHRWWNPAAAYAQSKLCAMLWARALQGRLERLADGAPGLPGAPRVVLAHPGWAHTNIHNATGSAAIDRLVGAVTTPFAQSSAAGALPLAEASIGDYPPLTYLGPDGFMHWRGEPGVQQPSDLAGDEDAARAVWDLGVRETGTDL